jgi:hypothetical protein
MAKKLLLSTTILAAFVSLHAPQAHAADIKIGDINSYSALPAFAVALSQRLADRSRRDQRGGRRQRRQARRHLQGRRRQANHCDHGRERARRAGRRRHADRQLLLQYRRLRLRPAEESDVSRWQTVD